MYLERVYINMKLAIKLVGKDGVVGFMAFLAYVNVEV